MPISSNRRQRVIEFATPKVADLVVVERVDASKNVNSAATADDAADVNGNFGAAHPDTTRFSGFKLALIKNGDNDQGQFQDWYYVKDRADQDDYNWEFQAAGANSPRFDTVVRTYVTLRSAFNDASPALASAMPVVSSDAFTVGDGYILFEKKQTRSGDETLDSLYVIEQHVFVRRVTIRSVEADKEFSYMDYSTGGTGTPYGGLVSKETLFHKDEAVKATVDFIDSNENLAGVSNTLYTVNDDAAGDDVGKAEYVFSDGKAFYHKSGTDYAFWGVDQAGVMREGKQLSDNWYVLFEREVIKKDTNGLVADYYTTKNMGWPAVFSTLYTQSWPRRDGSSQLILYPVFKREAYEGPTIMQIQSYWRKEPFDVPSSAGGVAGTTTRLAQIKPMEPMAMAYTTPMFNVQVKKSLHATEKLVYTTGTDDSEWEYVTYTAEWKATNYDDWPDEIVISDDQRPHRGGYLRTKVIAYKPETARADTDDDAGTPPTEP